MNAAASEPRVELVLLDGTRLPVPEGQTAGQAFDRHACAAITGGRCPYCGRPLEDGGVCRGPGHAACRWALVGGETPGWEWTRLEPWPPDYLLPDAR